MGIARIDDRPAGGALVEYDTDWCRHCQAAVRIARRGPRRGAWCARCGGIVCLPCGRRGVCTPFLRSIDQALRRVAWARAAGLQEG